MRQMKVQTRRRRGNAGGTLKIAVFLLLAAAVVFIVIALKRCGNEDRSIPEPELSQTSVREVSESEPVIEPVSVDFAVLDEDGGLTVTPSADDGNGEKLDGVTFTVTAVGLDGEQVYTEETVSGGKCHITKPTGNYKIIVEASGNTGGSVRTERTYYDEAGYDFIWPVTPHYKPLVHDYYLVSVGTKKIGKYTHNNGKQRQKHYVFGIKRDHYAFDITTEPNTQVRAAGDGTVVTVSTNLDATKTTGYGKYVVITHKKKIDGKAVHTLYAHLNSFKVKKGQKVKKGDIIGLSGSTGGSRLAHVHLEIRLGTNVRKHTVDPLQILPPFDLDSLTERPTEEDGFNKSSVRLYNEIADGEWKYTIRARALKKLRKNGVTVPKGAEVEVVKRVERTVTCKYEGKKFTADAASFTYTYD